MRSFAAAIFRILGADDGRQSKRAPQDDLTISLLTFGPGDNPFTKSGSNGLLVENARSARGVVYNLRNVPSDRFNSFPSFCSASIATGSGPSARSTLATYAPKTDRSSPSELSLTADQRDHGRVFWRGTRVKKI